MGLFGSKNENDEKEIVGLGIFRIPDYVQGQVVVFTPVDDDTYTNIKWIKPGGVKLIRDKMGFKEFFIF